MTRKTRITAKRHRHTRTRPPSATKRPRRRSSGGSGASASKNDKNRLVSLQNGPFSNVLSFLEPSDMAHLNETAPALSEKQRQANKIIAYSARRALTDDEIEFLTKNGIQYNTNGFSHREFPNAHHSSINYYSNNPMSRYAQQAPRTLRMEGWFWRNDKGVDVLHRDEKDGPALIGYRDDNPSMVTCEYYFRYGVLHRESGPAIMVKHDYKDQSEHSGPTVEVWCRDGAPHRDGDLPALIRTYLRHGKLGIETEEWWVNGARHRDNDLPAVVNTKDGYKEWYQNGLQHRDGDKPATEAKAERYRAWYTHGEMTEEQHDWNGK